MKTDANKADREWVAQIPDEITKSLLKRWIWRLNKLLSYSAIGRGLAGVLTGIAIGLGGGGFARGWGWWFPVVTMTACALVYVIIGWGWIRVGGYSLARFFQSSYSPDMQTLLATQERIEKRMDEMVERLKHDRRGSPVR